LFNRSRNRRAKVPSLSRVQHRILPVSGPNAMPGHCRRTHHNSSINRPIFFLRPLRSVTTLLPPSFDQRRSIDCLSLPVHIPCLVSSLITYPSFAKHSLHLGNMAEETTPPAQAPGMYNFCAKLDRPCRILACKVRGLNSLNSATDGAII